MIQADTIHTIRVCSIVLYCVAARRIEADAVVILRRVIFRDVAVIHIVEINPSHIVTRRPPHCEPRDIHPISSHREYVRCRYRGHSHHIRALAFQREPRLVHIHILGVTPAMHIDRIPLTRSIHRRLYRRGTNIERTTHPPPAAFIDVQLLGSRHAAGRESRQYKRADDRPAHDLLILCCVIFGHDSASFIP